jgi:hypothetical protein
MEKDPAYVVEPNDNHESSVDHDHIDKTGARDGARVNEAKAIYGDIDTAEEYGYVSRG